MPHDMTLDELLALPVSVDIETAGRAFGIGYTKAKDLARRGEFPCRVLKVGPKYRVPRSAILEALGIDPSHMAPGSASRRRSPRQQARPAGGTARAGDTPPSAA